MPASERLNDTEREMAVGEAVRRHAFRGERLGPEFVQQVRERGAEITEELCREHGEIYLATINARFRDDDEA